MDGNIKLHEISTQQLEAIERVLDTYLFKQPEFGEPWHPDYRKNKKSFDLLIRQTVAFNRTLKNSFLGIKKEVASLVSSVLAAESDERINKWIKDNFNTNADINLANNISDDIFPVYTNGAQAASAETKIPTTVSHTQAASAKFLTGYTLNLASDLNKTTAKNITQAVKTSIALNETKKEMTARINDVLDDPARSQMIAQTESVRAFTQGRLDAGREMGYDQKQWMNGQPGACQVCQDLDGTIVDIDDQFDTGSDLGSVDGPPAHPNCKCAPPKLINSQVKGSEVLGGWITKNGAHIFLPDGDSSVQPVKNIGTAYEVYQGQNTSAPWKMRVNDFIDQHPSGKDDPFGILDIHRGSVVDAISRGMAVPQAVIDDYKTDDKFINAVRTVSRQASEVKGGWITKNGAHIYLPDGSDSSGSEREAIQFSKDSTIKNTLYHGASDETLSDIQKFGFRPDPEGRYGKAVYFTTGKMDAFDYGTNVLSAKVNVGSVKIIDSMSDVVNEATTLGVSVEDRLASYASSYDALKITGEGTIAVFNPRNIMSFATDRTT